MQVLITEISFHLVFQEQEGKMQFQKMKYKPHTVSSVGMQHRNVGLSIIGVSVIYSVTYSTVHNICATADCACMFNKLLLSYDGIYKGLQDSLTVVLCIPVSGCQPERVMLY